MTILDNLLGNQGDEIVTQLANRFGLNAAQVQGVVGQLVPALAAGMMHHVGNGGMGALMDRLRSDEAARYVEQPQRLQEPQAVEAGNGILGKIFGSKDVSRNVARSTETKTGITSDIVKKMLPLVAIMAASALSKRTERQALPGQQGNGHALSQWLGSQWLGGTAAHASIADEVLGLLRQHNQEYA